ncbi:MAG: formate--tetrahydrofolate ligase [Kiritimatiellae bacterium]|jgi:formyltetrahydrofolate synthetase|nr:formate--tetrahydrofolate ligase [Kiritimatiellia bacterium]
MTNLDPVKMEDWEIAEAAEENLRTVADIATELGLNNDEWSPYGKFLGKIETAALLKRPFVQRAKYIDVTAITPTPLGEGKTTTTIGLVQGLGKLGKKAMGTVRQPSGGPTFNIKGSAAGGGLAQVVPLAPLSLGLTGDIDAITNANNLAMVALTARMQHENNYDDERLAKSFLKRIDIDPERIQMRWAMDFCAQALRNIEIGKGGKMDGYEMPSGFYITVASEVMAVLAMAADLKDLRERIGKIIVAYDKTGNPVTTASLEVDGAMTAWLVRAINPTIMQTIEGQPVLVHAGPFANIAIGQSSVIADRLGVTLSDYLVTESGFASDIGYEKFWNIKCRCSGLKPDAVVIVATVRALKSHGGGPPVRAGRELDPVYTSENIKLLEKGCENLLAHIDIVKRSGIRPVVCLNSFYTDTPAEYATVQRVAEAAGARFAVSDHWLKGGEGATDLAAAVIEACEDTDNNFAFLSDLNKPISSRIEDIVKEVYGGDGVTYSDEATAKLKALESNPELANLPICMAKTQYSLSHDPKLSGRPKGWTMPIRDLLIYQGAGLIVPVAGDIKLMPGTASNAAFRRIDVDTETGKVRGLF